MTNAYAMSRTLLRPFTPRPALDRVRIAAESGTLAINAVLLMLLLAPIAPPIPAPPRHETVVVPVAPRVPPRPVDPIPVRVERDPTPRPAAPAQTPRIAAPSDATAPALDLPGEPSDTFAAEPVVPTLDPPAPASTVGTRLQHLSAPPPPYPRGALRDGLSGTVMLEVVVDIDGRPTEVRIARTSGHRELDLAARRHVLARWRFRPAVLDGRPVLAVGLVPVEFVLD